MILTIPIVILDFERHTFIVKFYLKNYFIGFFILVNH